MRIFPYMWTTESLSGSSQALLGSLKEGKYAKKTWFLLLPETNTHPIEIIQGSELSKKVYTESERIIVGAAESKEEAEALAGSILSMLFKRDPKLDLHAYIDRVMKEESDA